MFMRMGSQLLERTSPIGLVLAGAALALSVPIVRRSIRAATVLTTRGVFRVNDTVRQTGAAIKDELEDIISEARGTGSPIRTSLESRQRRIAAATSSGLMSVSHKARSLSEKVRRFADDEYPFNISDASNNLENEH